MRNVLKIFFFKKGEAVCVYPDRTAVVYTGTRNCKYQLHYIDSVEIESVADPDICPGGDDLQNLQPHTMANKSCSSTTKC